MFPYNIPSKDENAHMKRDRWQLIRKKREQMMRAECKTRGQYRGG
ncbi:hypothetical protein GYH30_032441 [Glycine max]|nr:hypothetical protein GYH30_032441 [Glycine max]